MTEVRSNCHHFQRERSDHDFPRRRTVRQRCSPYRLLSRGIAPPRFPPCCDPNSRAERDESSQQHGIFSRSNATFINVLGGGDSRKHRAATQLDHLCFRNVSERSPQRSCSRINGLQLAFAACSGLFHLAPEASRCFKTLKRRTKKLQAATTKLLMFRYF